MSQTKVATNALLKGILTDTLSQRGPFFNADLTTDVGIYTGPGPSFTGGTYPSDPPSDWLYGVLIVVHGRYGANQILISEFLKVAVRNLRSGQWQPWKILATTTAT